jgi:hypothetical protein
VVTDQSWRAGAAAAATEAFEGLAESWGDSLAFTVVLLPVVAVVARGLTTIGLLIPGLSGPVVVAVVLAALCVVQLGVVLVGFVRVGSGRTAALWRVGNIMSVLLSLGLYVETFAAVTACVWRGSGQHVGAWVGLWRAESFYLWHVLRSIPVLDITGTVGWQEPAYAAAHTPVGLVLAFKVLVVLPLLRAAVSGYQLVTQESTVRGSQARPETAHSRWWAPGITGAVVVGVGILCFGVTWLAMQALDRNSLFNSWWIRTAMPAAHADGPSVERWAMATPSIVLLIVGLYLLFAVVYTAVGQADAILPNARSWWTTGMLLLAAIAEIYGIMLWDTSLLITLNRLGLGVHLPDSAGPSAVIETLVWQALHMLPGPDITGTLHWTAPAAMDGWVTAWVLLSLKVFVAGTIVFLGLPVVRTAIIRARYGPVIDVWTAVLATGGHLAKTLRWWNEPFADWGRYRDQRAHLDQAAAVLTTRHRFAELGPPLRALLDVLPDNDVPRPPPAARAEITSAVLAFRVRVVEAFPDAAAAVDERPAWLAVQQTPAQSASGSAPT